MIKLLLTITMACPVLAFAQASGIIPEAELRAQQHTLDSLQAVTNKARRETQDYNDVYIRQHPDYLRQHPEIVKAHPEYRKRYAKYLGTPKH